ncbi:hypothetical protein [Chloracidobacterium aggregatum]|uniref:Uncharacterized protein n=1 Tax=Chloracidobacterium sp. N TaxID=2821540 RepID=A0ABX8B504_9BACT|nr:hypothetical protein [Chloracidobacterium aggregatum]QUV85551.1 hypothetical protein J8C03_04595 [Chloracidobacterium sp. 2]QUV90968.1 hypothetical protein J8C04_00690 [Chloracidobacterium sp. A]QUV94156.1 hypothetical protein J8C05_01485 [Chloracidobacterium sp. N]QUV97354.1 hypothetical protein J8C00_02540 [Chloracidobacterium sp. E]
MNHEVQLLFFVVLGLAGQVVAVGGALLAFRLGARTGADRHRALPPELPAGKSTSFTRSIISDTASEPTAPLDTRAVALLRCLRLPPVSDHEALLSWYGRLQLEGMALAATMSSETQTVFRQALDAIRDILDTRNLDDRYELLAAALLPVYEGLHARSSGPSEAALSPPAAEPLNRFTPNAPLNGQAAVPVAYRETPSQVSEKSRLAKLFEQVEAAARARETLASNPPGTRHGEAPLSGPESPTNGNSKVTSEASDHTPGHTPVHAPGTQLDTSRLSRRLAEILKSADRNDHPSDPAESSHSTPEPATDEHSAPELHLVSPPIKSRLKRSGTLTPEQEVARKAAHVVGRAREWYGRPDITLREVQSACAAFGLEFNEVAARAELAKPLAEDVF